MCFMDRENRQFRMGSLFSGSGGFELAATLCGIEPVWASEVEPFAIKVTRARFPNMKHYGDISKINGAELEPVDLVTGGSPCTCLSQAGKREGMSKKCLQCGHLVIATEESDICQECGGVMAYTRSGLFMEQIRVIKEMRDTYVSRQLRSGRTDFTIRPRFMLWENVTGAFSSNKGEDFRAVLEETARIVDKTAIIPRPPKGKWNNAGLIMGDGYSIAWRVLDAQFWGTPQRRRRIALVADFGGQCAGEILFKRDGLQRNFTESRHSWQSLTGCVAESVGETGECSIGINGDIAGTLDSNYWKGPGARAGTEREVVAVPIQEPITMQVRCGKEGCGKGALIQKDLSATLSTSNVQTLFQPTYSVDEKMANTYVWEEQANTLAARDYKQPQAVVMPKKAYGICSYESNSMKSDNPNSGIYEADTSRTLDLNGGNPACNQGGIAICEPIPIQGKETTNATEQHGVCYSLDRASFNQGKNAKYDISIQEDVSQTLVARGPNAVMHEDKKSYRMEAFGQYSESDKASCMKSRDHKDATDLIVETEYIVRRLTPLECSRLQGFPDWWIDNIAIENPTEEDLQFWREVFETHREIVTHAKKPKTDKQIIKWLKEPDTDGAKYKLWGNGISLPCFLYVMEGIKEVLEREEEPQQNTYKKSTEPVQPQ